MRWCERVSIVLRYWVAVSLNDNYYWVEQNRMPRREEVCNSAELVRLL